ncbi:uncharacterized protein LOC129321036 [Prosopis cineraria]|uniref:uncharacterized protein LOC129321036 n=1 Tax=Prosopis cineraria TaxID=364024 RepID=UPI00240F6F31|nr:uncharacterized protein LOC129321036 [Prosopis cineraria]
MMALTVSQKPVGASFDLMQNCDLPPPSKVFKGSDNKLMLSMNRRPSNILVKREYTGELVNDQNDCDGNPDVLEILKALRSSQAREREAEKKSASLINERDCLSNALMKEAMQLYAYQQQVRLLEFQVSSLQQKMFRGFATSEEDEGSTREDDNEEEKINLVWILALALSWGMGVGTAIACRYFL